MNRLIFAFVVGVAALSGCGGGGAGSGSPPTGGGGTPPPATTIPAPTPTITTATATIVTGTSPTTVPFAAFGGFSGTITLPGVQSGAGASVSVIFSLGAPPQSAV